MIDELLDVVNGHDEVVGKIFRKDYDQILTEQDRYIRAADLFIVNDEGKIWIPTRTAHKKIAPNGYDYSAAGHVESGEDYLQTIIRETQEEINLVISKSNIVLVAKLKSESIRYIRNIYLHYTNQTPVYNLDDFVSAEWLSPEELIDSIDSGHPAKSNLKETVNVLQDYLRSDSLNDKAS